MSIITVPLPIQLLNGTVADAGQVMTDLNAIASNVNANAAKNGVNSDITSLTALISIAPGLTITGATIMGSIFSGGIIVGSTIDSTTTGITQPTGTNTTQLATTEFVNNIAFDTALPDQTGNAGKFVSTDGTNAFWTFINLAINVIGQLPLANGGSGGQSGAPDFLLFQQGII